MDTNDHVAILRELNAHAFHPDTNQELAAKLQALPGSDADKFIGGMEILYAYKDVLNGDGIEVLGALSAYASLASWGALSVRAAAICRALKRDLGESIAQDPADDPEPDAARREGFNWKAAQDAPAELEA